ncbi:hypothetical protein [Pontixanthobacter sp. CEM42]|uniref:hypothetical protein n=1 Tax=Pontixanthobacter sp. CEM42 TaxID=2792077 RepID=UPI001ADFBD73|nr:hypothetical protein [Pontixanthobacter sp. CEM42]
MNGGILAILFAAVLSVAIGAYLSFGEGQSSGAVFMGVGAVFFSLAAIRMSKSKGA